MIRAADIIIGDCLLEVQYQTDSILTTVVTEITASIETGVYAPLTNTGKVISFSPFDSKEKNSDRCQWTDRLVLFGCKKRHLGPNVQRKIDHL